MIEKTECVQIDEQCVQIDDSFIQRGFCLPAKRRSLKQCLFTLQNKCRFSYCLGLCNVEISSRYVYEIDRALKSADWRRSWPGLKSIVNRGFQTGRTLLYFFRPFWARWMSVVKPLHHRTVYSVHGTLNRFQELKKWVHRWQHTWVVGMSILNPWLFKSLLTLWMI